VKVLGGQSSKKSTCHGYAFEGGEKLVNDPTNYLGLIHPCYEVVTTGGTHARWGNTHTALMGSYEDEENNKTWPYKGKLSFGPVVLHDNQIYQPPSETWKKRAEPYP
jgi:hypothetical protein